MTTANDVHGSPSILTSRGGCLLLASRFREGNRSTRGGVMCSRSRGQKAARQSVWGLQGEGAPANRQTQASASWGLFAAGSGVGGTWVLGGDAQSPRAPGRSRQRARQKRLGRKRASSSRGARHLRAGGSRRPPRRPTGRASASSGLCRADALPACEQGLFSLHALGLRFYEELPSVGALGIFIPGLRSARVTVGLGNVPAA